MSPPLDGRQTLVRRAPGATECVHGRGTPGDPHARPAAAGLRQLDPQGARRRAPGARGPRSSACASRRSCSSSAPGRIRPASCTARTSTQSDVFVGLYWERYGWVAPGRGGVGAGGRVQPAARPTCPRLIYIKTPAPSREPRLTELLDRIRADDRASYKYFETAEELGELLARRPRHAARRALRQQPGRAAPRAAAATADRVAEPSAARHRSPSWSAATATSPPCVELLGATAPGSSRSPGPGGIGKSRLAIAAAARLGRDVRRRRGLRRPRRRSRPGARAAAIAAGARRPRHRRRAAASTSSSTALARPPHAARARQLRAGAGRGARRSPHCSRPRPGSALLVTSRTLLRVGGEQSYDARPAAADDASVSLFVERAHAVQARTSRSRRRTRQRSTGICAALDGVPLAIELAAARIRVLAARRAARAARPAAVRCWSAARATCRSASRPCGAPSSGARSCSTTTERGLLARLGVFEGGFTLEAAECGRRRRRCVRRGPARDVLSATSARSSTTASSASTTRARRPRFSCWRSCGSTPWSSWTPTATLTGARDAHAALLPGPRRPRRRPPLTGRRPARVGAAARRRTRQPPRGRCGTCSTSGDWERAAQLAWSLYLYWWVAGLLGEVRGWMDELLASGDPLATAPAPSPSTSRGRSRSGRTRTARVAAGLTESADLFRRAGDRRRGGARPHLPRARPAGRRPDAG